MNKEQQRAAFEVWMRKDHPNHSLEYVNGRYTYSPPHRLWEAYQAALASPEVQALREDAYDIEAAAKTLADCMDYPWEPMPEKGREAMRKYARRIIDHSRRIEGEGK